MISYDICLSPSSLLHLVWSSLVLPMFLQMALFHSFYGWVIFHCIYAPHFLYPFLCWWTYRWHTWRDAQHHQLLEKWKSKPPALLASLHRCLKMPNTRLWLSIPYQWFLPVLSLFHHIKGITVPSLPKGRIKETSLTRLSSIPHIGGPQRHPGNPFPDCHLQELPQSKALPKLLDLLQ